MRKPRDFDSEMEALNERSKVLRQRKVHQLGELVIATRADTLPVEQLAGVLLAAVSANETIAKEAWSERGTAFFQRSTGAAGGTPIGSTSAAQDRSGTPASSGQSGSQ